ncbi:unnamed protein product [Triticum turgidum subsp. durum]|uniref:Vps53 C-terminal domain-containing protein n=1 Tax=Triticum turgidum subsp. durum TaxID=4567 RepID=A0A9R1S709_TRITD|nr:unnamed protein product [Triticum turgidum subsp. durum]
MVSALFCPVPFLCWVACFHLLTSSISSTNLAWSSVLSQYIQVQAHIGNWCTAGCFWTLKRLRLFYWTSQLLGKASYSKFVTREMSKAEALLKVILSPVDSVASTYRALLPEGTPLEFQRILELKGLKKADQQAILEDFNKHSPSIKHPTITPTAAPPVATATASVPLPTQAVAASPSMSTALTGALANREDVLARAAALGRGAATTGFKRFLALTEAAKDRKDGPFRKLFNA